MHIMFVLYCSVIHLCGLLAIRMRQAGGSNADVMESTGAHVGFPSLSSPLYLSVTLCLCMCVVFPHRCGSSAVELIQLRKAHNHHNHFIVYRYNMPLLHFCLKIECVYKRWCN